MDSVTSVVVQGTDSLTDEQRQLVVSIAESAARKDFAAGDTHYHSRALSEIPAEAVEVFSRHYAAEWALLSKTKVALTVYEEAYLATLNLREQLKVAEDSLRDMGENLVPEALDAAGLTKAKLPMLGYDVIIDNSVHTGVKVPDRAEAIEWLVANGHEDLVKLEVRVQFGLRDKDNANSAYRMIQAECNTAKSVEADRTIPGATLKKFVTDRLKKGEPLPEVFGTYIRRFANIVVPKPKKELTDETA